VPDGTYRRASWALIGLGASLITLGSGLLAAGLVPAAGSRPPHAALIRSDSTSATPAATAPAAAASDSPWWKPLPAAHSPFVPVKLVIPRLHVEAPIEVRGTDANNVMEAPDRPSDAAWYRFTSKPGSGSNAVFAGHRDFARVGPAIFWHLDQLGPGDLIEVVSPQQTEIAYRVSQAWQYGVATIPMKQVLAADVGDEVTLITCSGRYTPSTGYDHRLVVRAVRAA
jgi:LPXTG-site transpeptidase (sortase) family protein